MEDPCLGLLYPEEAPINMRTLLEDLMRKINVKFKPSLAGSTHALAMFGTNLMSLAGQISDSIRALLSLLGNMHNRSLLA